MLDFLTPAVGPRVEIRPFDAADAADVHRFQGDPTLLPYIPWPLRTADETAAWVTRVAGGAVRAAGDDATWAVVQRADRRVIGAVNLTWSSAEHAQAEVGFVLAADTHGRGLAAEATGLLLDTAFPALGLHRAYARVDARNTASLRMLRRLGLREEGRLIGREFFKGEWTDIVIAAVLRTEWEQRRAAAPNG